MRERDIERAFVKAVRAEHGMALKFVSPGLSGVPDRLVLMPEGKIAFVELKVPGEKMRPVQVKRKQQIESLGFAVYLIDRKEQIGSVIHEVIKC